MKIMAIFVKIKEKLIELYKKNKKLFFAALFLIIVAAVMLFLPTQNTKNDSKVLAENENFSENLSYISSLENKLANMLLKLSVIDSVKVLVMADESEKYVYLTQTETTKNGENEIIKEEIVYDKNGSSQSPIKVMTEYPKISGVMIVINKVDASTKISIQNAVAGVLNIDSSCIYILQDG